MKHNFATGSMSALIKPFKNNKVDFECYEKLIKRQIKYGMTGIVPVGTTGESPTLSHNEHKECLEVAISAVKGSGAKVLAGAGSNSTAEAIDLAKFAQNAGADSVLSIIPYYNKPTQEGIYQHFKAIAQEVSIGIVLYNVPGRTISNLEISTAIRLSKEFSHIYGIKEASGVMDKTVEFNAKIPNIDIFSGEDSINYPIMANGGAGVISVTGNLLPDKISSLVKKALDGDFKGSLKINAELYDVNKILFIESNPIPIKLAMYLSGLISTLEYRLPLVPPSKEHFTQIENIIKNYEIVK